MIQEPHHAIPCAIFLALVPTFTIALVLYAAHQYNIHHSQVHGRNECMVVHRRLIIAGVVLLTLALLCMLLGSFSLVSHLQIPSAILNVLLNLECKLVLSFYAKRGWLMSHSSGHCRFIHPLALVEFQSFESLFALSCVIIW